MLGFRDTELHLCVHIIYHDFCKCFCTTTLKARFMGQHGAHLGPTGPRWAPCWPHELCCLGSFVRTIYNDMFPALNYTCSVQATDQRDCGWPGVIGPMCRAAGCCWDDSLVNPYWCFFQHGEFHESNNRLMSILNVLLNRTIMCIVATYILVLWTQKEF